MKNHFLIGLFVCLFISCSRNEELTNNGEYYTLIKMSGSIAGSETTGEDMEWQETICLYSNNTFTKIRFTEDEKIEAFGSYSKKIIESEEFIELVYDIDNSLIANCTGNLIEHLIVLDDYSLQGTWSYCDGPVLEYTKAMLCGTI